jgi:hypothetical protein
MAQGGRPNNVAALFGGDEDDGSGSEREEAAPARKRGMLVAPVVYDKPKAPSKGAEEDAKLVDEGIEEKQRLEAEAAQQREKKVRWRWSVGWGR